MVLAVSPGYGFIGSLTLILVVRVVQYCTALPCILHDYLLQQVVRLDADAGGDAVSKQHLFGVVVPAWDVQLPPRMIMSVLIDDYLSHAFSIDTKRDS